MINNNPKTKIKLQNKRKRFFKKFTKHYNKWFPSSQDMVPFEKRFKLITKHSEGSTAPSDLVLRTETQTCTGYSPKRPEESTSTSIGNFKTLLTPWERLSMVFRHPKFPYKTDWLHDINGEMLNKYFYNYFEELDCFKDFEKGFAMDSTGWCEYNQYCSDIDSLRRHFTGTWYVRDTGRNNYKLDLEEAVSRSKQGLSAVSSSSLTLASLDDKISAYPTLVQGNDDPTGADVGEMNKNIVSYIFYDTMRRGVYFHLFTNNRFLEYTYGGQCGFNYHDLPSYWEKSEQERKRLEYRHDAIPFLITINASTNQAFMSEEETEIMEKISTQYLNLFEKWLTHQFKHGNQLQYSIEQDSMRIDDTEYKDIPIVNL